MIEAASLMQIPEVRHGYFTRQGGVSTGLYAELNCAYGTGDDAQRVAANRAHVATALGIAAEGLVSPYQHHSADVIVVEEPWVRADAPRADGLVTATRGIGVAVTTADCSPVLFADGDGEMVAAAHAGWRGALAGVTDQVIETMVGLGAARDRIRAAIGPTISGDNYEVGPEFCAAFLDDDGANSDLFQPSTRDDHFMFDLPAYLERRLAASGIGAVERTGQCTYADEARFFSFRRTTHKSEETYGCQLSAITLGPDRF